MSASNQIEYQFYEKPTASKMCLQAATALNRMAKKKQVNKNKNMQPKITSVMFVEQTRGGTLALALRQKMETLAPMLGYRFRIVEKAGTCSPTCGRNKCHHCSQKSDKVEPCSAGNVLYESRCTLCNGMEKGKESTTIKDSRELPSIYVGETSRSLMERAGEHHRDYRNKKMTLTW